MKIALCLSGQPRYLDFGYLKIKKLILDKFNPDVFVHTWWDDSLVDKPFDLSKKLSYNRTCKWEKNTLTNIEEFYSPKYFNYESQRNFHIFEDVDYGLLNPISPYSMYYSIKMSNNLKIKYEKENNFRYDVVIRCRFDIDLISLNLDLSNLEPDKIYVDGEINRGQPGVPNDQFAIGNSYVMDYYANLYENLTKYREGGFRLFMGEQLLKHHVEKSKYSFYFCEKKQLQNSIVINI